MGKYMQDVLISVCEEGGMWKRGNTRCRSVPTMGYHLWQKEEASRCPVKIISVQIESNSQLAPDARTPSQPPLQVSPSDFINLPKYMTVFFFLTTFLGPHPWQRFYLSIYQLLCAWNRYGRIHKNVTHWLCRVSCGK